MNRSYRHRSLAGVVFGCLGVLAACGGPDRSERGARLEIVVADGRVELVRGTPIQAADHPADPASDTDVRWELVNDDGDVVASGRAPDPRLVHVESFGAADVVGDVVRAGAGVIDIAIPDLHGTLRVVDSDGARLGELVHTPLDGREVKLGGGGGDGKADIDFDTDVIGRPVLVAGTGIADHRFTMMFLPEGYRRDELTRFHGDVSAALATLQVTPGYAEHWDHVNAFYQDVQSAESGISDPASHAEKDTAFNITFGDGTVIPRRCIMPSNSWNAVSVANVRRFAGDVKADVVIIVANSAEIGGCARQTEKLIVQANGDDVGRTLAHELGHALFGLSDEYTEGGRSCGQGPNLTKDLQHIPWRDQIRPSTPIPTPDSAGDAVVGAFEGGGYCSQGIWRPQQNCLMRSLDRELCQVCRGIVEQRFQQRETAITAATVTNRTDESIWLKCDGWGVGCSDWTKIEPGASADMEFRDGRILVTTSLIPSKVFAVPAAMFSIYANAADPFTPPPDGGVDAGVDASIDASPPIDAGSDAPPASCTVANLVVNEVQTGGTSGTDEFVELHNPCDGDVDLSGARLVYRSANGNGPTDTTVLATLSGTLPADGYLIAAGAGFTGTAQLRLSSGLSATAGAVGVRTPAGVLVDSVGWGPTTNPLVEGTAAPAPAARRSITRNATSTDTNNNAADFTVTLTPTPGGTI